MCKAVKALATVFASEAFEKPNSLDAYLSGTQQHFDTILFFPLLYEHFKYPVLIEKFNVSDVNFREGSFFIDGEAAYFALIPREDTREILHLKKLTYTELGEYEGKLKIGHNFHMTIPCNNSDEIFFFSKHFFFYHIFLILKETEKVPGLFRKLLTDIIDLLRNMYGGMYAIEGDFQKFTLSPQICSSLAVKQVYDKYIFSKIRQFNNLNRRLTYSMQVINGQNSS
jgi:hypothetical protein